MRDLVEPYDEYRELILCSRKMIREKKALWPFIVNSAQMDELCQSTNLYVLLLLPLVSKAFPTTIQSQIITEIFNILYMDI